jgi:hypothetical protein
MTYPPEWTAINLATANLAKAGQDQRTAERFLADLEREAEASLRRDPERWMSKHMDSGSLVVRAALPARREGVSTKAPRS